MHCDNFLNHEKMKLYSMKTLHIKRFQKKIDDIARKVCFNRFKSRYSSVFDAFFLFTLLWKLLLFVKF